MYLVEKIIRKRIKVSKKVKTFLLSALDVPAWAPVSLFCFSKKLNKKLMQDLCQTQDSKPITKKEKAKQKHDFFK